MTYRLVIGDKNISSWSLRPWLALRHAGIPFEEINIKLRQPDTKAQILRYSPAGKVPTLLTDDGQAIWDSLAILEYLAEAHPRGEALAREARRPRARPLGVGGDAFGLRGAARALPDGASRPHAHGDIAGAVAAEVRRIVALWRDCRRRFGASGPLLFGGFTAADAMYAPVASRFRTYLPDLAPYGDDGTAQAYVDALFALPAMADWEEGARREAQASA